MSDLTPAAVRPRSITPSAATLSPPAKKARLEPEPAASAVEEMDVDPDIQPSGSTKPQPRSKKGRNKKFKRPPPPEPGTSEDVILRDVLALIGDEDVESLKKEGKDYASLLTKGQELDLVVSELSSNGESISLVPSSISSTPWAVIVPFALPGEKIRARVYASARFYSMADLVSVVEPNNEMRDNSLIKCRYFGVCAGCQYQMLSYETQLKLKQQVVAKAYRNFFTLSKDLIPPVQPTIASPQTYGYRTKITPHFEVSTGRRGDKNKDKADIPQPEARKVDIGFGEKGRRRVVDIEECVIATPALNEALPGIRTNVHSKIHTYKRGATLLLRDSFQRPTEDLVSRSPDPPPVNPADDAHVCITDYKATVRERIGETVFEFPAGSFFQNNNSVLLPLVEYVRDAIFVPTATDRPTHLVDTYCGAGFFGISLAPHFVHVTGVEISAESIASARTNATLNNLPPTEPTPGVLTESITFSAGKSESIFESVSHFPASHTVVVIDPPRKGCDNLFLQQLVKFRPRTLVYVSCNVHTQARDLGDLIKLMAEAEGEKQTYRIDSLRGFDLFPQTAHVESVAVLKLV